MSYGPLDPQCQACGNVEHIVKCPLCGKNYCAADFRGHYCPERRR